MGDPWWVEVKQICRNISEFPAGCVPAVGEPWGPVTGLGGRPFGYSVRQAQLDDLEWSTETLCILITSSLKCLWWWCLGGFASHRDLWWGVHGKVRVKCFPWPWHRENKWNTDLSLVSRVPRIQGIIILMAKIYYWESIQSKIGKGKGSWSEIWGKPGTRILSQWSHTGCAQFLRQWVVMHVKCCQ